MKNINFEKKLNNIFTCLIILITIMILNTILLINKTGTIFSSGNSNENIIQESNDDYDLSAFKEIDGKDIVKETKGENTVVYIGRASCTWCVKFAPILTKSTSDYDLNTLYIDIAKIINFNQGGGIIDQTSYDILMGLNTVTGLEDYMEEEFGATPMLLIIKDGKIIDAQTGYTESSELNSFLEKNGFKK